MNENHKKTISKFLSLILRHNPEKINLQLDQHGWADVDELISKSTVRFTSEELEEVVETNDKQRFAFNADHTKIRASQGHSIEIDLALTPQQPPEFLYHGTVARFLDGIRKEGLQKMSRQYLHLSHDKETATKVGSRRGIPVILNISSGQMHRDGILFYLSDNGVWLTDHVAPQYIN